MTGRDRLRTLLLAFFVAFFASCGGDSQKKQSFGFPDSLIGKSYRSTVEIGADSDFSGSKIEGTSYYVHRSRFDSKNVLILAKGFESPVELTTFEARRVLILPPLPDSALFVFGYCTMGGVEDKRVVAIAKYNYSDETVPALYAWRVNVAAERFHPLAPDSIECLNEFAFD